jgi:hypothetical protein
MKTRLILLFLLVTGGQFINGARALAQVDGGVPGADDAGLSDDAAAVDAVVAEADAADAIPPPTPDAPVVATPDAAGGAAADAPGARDGAADATARPSDAGRHDLIADDDGCSYGRGGRGAWWAPGLIGAGFAIGWARRRRSAVKRGQGHAPA